MRISHDTGRTEFSVELENRDQAIGALRMLEDFITCADVELIEYANKLRAYIEEQSIPVRELRNDDQGEE